MNNNIEILLKECNEYGFSLTLEFIISTKITNFKDIKNYLLNYDLRQIKCLNTYFPQSIDGNDVTLIGPRVFQIVKISNINQPLKRRHDDSNPRLLYITVSDGSKVNMTGFEYESIPDLKSNTPPGV
jgi:hypothetical protein